jgi:hypothetical protein
MSFHPQHWQRHCLFVLEALQILQSLITLKVSISFFARKYMKHCGTQQNNALFVFSHAYVATLAQTFLNFHLHCKKQATMFLDTQDLLAFLTILPPRSIPLIWFPFEVSILP